jgi:DivIVA protein
VDLSRTAVEKTDFPRAVDGYESTAVDAHLRSIADEVEALRSGDSAQELAVRTGQQVKDLLEVAQQTVVSITEQARREAQAIVEEAEREGSEIRRLSAVTTDELPSLFEMLRNQEEINHEMRRAFERLDAALPERPSTPSAANITSTAPDEVSGGDRTALSRSGLLDAEPAEFTATSRSTPETGDELQLLALNLLLNETPLEEVRARLGQEYPGADVEGAIADAKRRL